MSLPLILLHGAIGSADQLLPLKSELEKSFPKIYLFNFPGHGGKEFPDEEFSIQIFAESLLQFLDGHNLPTVNIFGYSMGGYVALYLAKHHPKRINKIVTLATKFEWSESIAQQEVKMLNPEKIAEKIPTFAGALENRHAPNDWKEVLSRTASMMLNLGVDPELKDSDYVQIKNNVLLMLGDSDKMVSREETECVHRKLSNCELLMIPETTHPIEQVELEKILSKISEFLR